MKFQFLLSPGTSKLVLDLFLGGSLQGHVLIELLRPFDELEGLGGVRVGRERARQVHLHVEDDVGPVNNPVVHKSCRSFELSKSVI